MFDTLLSTEHLEVEEEFDRLHELSMNEDNQTEDVPHSVFGKREDKSKNLMWFLFFLSKTILILYFYIFYGFLCKMQITF